MRQHITTCARIGIAGLLCIVSFACGGEEPFWDAPPQSQEQATMTVPATTVPAFSPAGDVVRGTPMRPTRDTRKPAFRTALGGNQQTRALSGGDDDPVPIHGGNRASGDDDPVPIHGGSRASGDDDPVPINGGSRASGDDDPVPINGGSRASGDDDPVPINGGTQTLGTGAEDSPNEGKAEDSPNEGKDETATGYEQPTANWPSPDAPAGVWPTPLPGRTAAR